MATDRLFCTFFLANEIFGVDVHSVQEVLDYQTVTPVPLSPKAVTGLMNLRGQIITVIDLRQRLDIATHREKGLSMNVVINTVSGAVSLLVDKIGDVMVVDDSQFEAPPDTLDDGLRKLIYGVYKMAHHKVVLVLDVDAIANLQPG